VDIYGYAHPQHYSEWSAGLHLEIKAMGRSCMRQAETPIASKESCVATPTSGYPVSMDTRHGHDACASDSAIAHAVPYLRDQPLEGLEFMARAVVDVFWTVHRADVHALEALKPRYTTELVERLVQILAGMQDPVMVGAAKEWIGAISRTLRLPSSSFFARRRKRHDLLALLTNSRMNQSDSTNG
jgi:hypothetical protein